MPHVILAVFGVIAGRVLLRESTESTVVRCHHGTHLHHQFVSTRFHAILHYPDDPVPFNEEITRQPIKYGVVTV